MATVLQRIWPLARQGWCCRGLATSPRQIVTVATLLHRLPTLEPLPSSMEREAMRWKELEHKVKSWEYPDGFWPQKDITNEQEIERLSPSQSVNKELDRGKKLQIAARTTVADERHLKSTIERALDQHLYFVVGRSDATWNLPEVVADVSVDKASLRKAARRALRMGVGNAMTAKFFSPAPCAHQVQSVDGQEVVSFFFSCRLWAGSKGVVGVDHPFMWLTKQELLDTIPEERANAIAPLLQ